MSKAKKWLLGYFIFALVIAVFSHTVLASIFNLGSAIAYYYIPFLVLGFIWVMSQDGLSNYWS